ncbi:MAG: TetR/AcrR family transcriptional regulator [Lachnospiraceae bacterium]|nr:TetR/AcrR family transcriptional regulator [Lachnospiraceae bacterium]MDE7184890.1 TetR/AcrR family transcriptional regulator [Lachnospiraceae bacterium]
MGVRTVQKRKYIVEKARSVFCRNGYRAVTMKDIVDICEISRGGLYLHFASTRELFAAVLEEEHLRMAADLQAGMAKGATPGEQLLLYLDEQKKVIMKKKENLTAATYEYLFENHLTAKNNPVKKWFDEDAALLTHLITEGVKQEWMDCEDAAEAARNILYTLEGLKVSARAMGVTAARVDKEIEYIMGTLGMVVK